MINWVTSWGGPLGTASGQQITIPIEPILDQTKLVSPDAALQISSVYACVELLAQTLSTLPLLIEIESIVKAIVKAIVKKQECKYDFRYEA